MEASVAAGQAGDAGESDAGGAQADPQMEAMLAAFPDMQQQQQEIYNLLQQQAQSQAAPSEPEEAPYDLSFFDDSEPGYDPAVAAANLAALIDKAATEKAQAAVGPVQQELHEMRTGQLFNQVANEFPDLRDPAIAKQVVDASRSYAQAMGQPQLGEHPLFIRAMYMMGRAADVASNESQGPNVAHLEGAGGAGPAGGGQVDLGQRIVDARGQGRGVLPFG